MKQVIVIAIPFEGDAPHVEEIKMELTAMLASYNKTSANTHLSHPRVVVADRVLN